MERSEPGEIDFLNQYDPELLWEGVPSGLSTHWMPVQSWWKADDELMALFELIKGKVDLFYKIYSHKKGYATNSDDKNVVKPFESL